MESPGEDQGLASSEGELFHHGARESSHSILSVERGLVSSPEVSALPTGSAEWHHHYHHVTSDDGLRCRGELVRDWLWALEEELTVTGPQGSGSLGGPCVAEPNLGPHA